MAYAEFKLCGGTFEAQLNDVSQEIAEPLFEELIMEGRRLERIFNLFDNQSELSKLNSRRKLIVSDEMAFVLRRALYFKTLTCGAFDVTRGREILERKGVNRKSGKERGNAEIFLRGNKAALEGDFIIDLGAIAKGYIADRLAEFMRERGVESGIINARGDMICFGPDEFEIEIENPFDERRVIETLKVKNKAVATSGTYRQFFGSLEKSHIIGTKELISATAVSESLTDADAIATSLMVLPSFRREDFLREFKGAKAILAENDGSISTLEAQ
ncbi:FAD:protein FMN transferase [Candidatus Woesearchaeota archaeon]|nr:MAG: FAD:protein FMN transferase [Candidatus Woesearchaeota archaeon]